MTRSAASSALVLCAALAAGCAGAPPQREAAPLDLQRRLAARAASYLGHTGPFLVRGERFGRDCTGFVQAVYESEGVPLRALMRRAAPAERSGVAAAFRAAESYGVVFGGGREWPAPGDLVFWHDTHDRNGNGLRDDRFTHVGIVEHVANGTVVFLHRGAKGVARGAMTPERPGERSDGGVLVNSPIRFPSRRSRGVPVLAGALFAGYGRLDPAKVSRALQGEGPR